MRQNFQTASSIAERLRQADATEFRALERALAADSRKTVRQAVETARRRLAAEAAEEARLAALYDCMAKAADGGVAVGLDEVGRGPLAGPVTAGAVVLPESPRIAGLNDSKQLSAEDRERIAAQVKDVAIAWSVQHVEPAYIDAHGMTAALRLAFSRAVSAVEAEGVVPDVALLDGNPLHFDARERNIVHGDARCACISAASVVAKVERDALMRRYAEEFPGYGLERNKGYASAEHQEAIRRLGLTPIHRASFCGGILQETLF